MVSLKLDTSCNISKTLTWSGPGFNAVRKLVNISHYLFPRLVNLNEHLSLIGKLSLNVWSTEDGLQIEPVTLTL